MVAMSVGVFTVAISNFSSTGGNDAICGTDNATRVKRPSTIATNPMTRTNEARMKRRIRIPIPTTERPINCNLTTSLITTLPCGMVQVEGPMLNGETTQHYE